MADGAQPDAAAVSQEAPAERNADGVAGETKPTANAAVSAATAAEQPEAKTAVDGSDASATALSEAIAADVARSVAATVGGEAAPDVSVAATPEGIVIRLTDDADYSMFPIGSAIPDDKTVALVEKIAGVLASRSGKIVIRGHTDGRPFHSADYDNWRLSAARAHMAYHMLTRGGLDESRVASIEGHADRDLKNAADPYAAENRRIEILLEEDAP